MRWDPVRGALSLGRGRSADILVNMGIVILYLLALQNPTMPHIRESLARHAKKPLQLLAVNWVPSN